MSVPITASMLYDMVFCPHRVTLDAFGKPSDRDEPNAFVELLWERGSLYEKEVMKGLDTPFTDLSMYAGEEKERRTLEAMQRGDVLIYGGRMQTDGLLGDPDLLRKEGGGYVAGDIKSGAGEEGSEDLAKPKKHYALQLALYTDLLERNGLLVTRHAFIWDIEVKKLFTTSRDLRASAIHGLCGTTIKTISQKHDPYWNRASRRCRHTAVCANCVTGTPLV